LFDLALLQVLSDNKTDFTKLSSTIALYLQIWDDYCNLCTKKVMFSLSDRDSYATHVPKIDVISV
jgi:hypothetical protein